MPQTCIQPRQPKAFRQLGAQRGAVEAEVRQLALGLSCTNKPDLRLPRYAATWQLYSRAQNCSRKQTERMPSTLCGNRARSLLLTTTPLQTSHQSLILSSYGFCGAQAGPKKQRDIPCCKSLARLAMTTAGQLSEVVRVHVCNYILCS